MNIGFVGVGSMGHAMILLLIQAGYRVSAWNRSAEALAGLSEIDVLAYQCTDQFIEGVMSANVFAAHQQLALAVHINSRVHGAAVLA